jgi:truncated hemoglobin YjbI
MGGRKRLAVAELYKCGGEAKMGRRLSRFLGGEKRRDEKRGEDMLRPLPAAPTL